MATLQRTQFSLVLGLFGFFFATASSLFASTPRIIDQLSPANLDAMRKGEQLVFTLKQSGPWPRITIFQKVESTPEEALAVFSDYETQVHYIPRMIAVRILSKFDRRTADVEYTLDLPWPFTRESYVMRDRVGDYALSPEEKGYSLNWELIRSGSLREAVGVAQFEAWDGGTVMMYRNFVYPSNGLAGAAKNEALNTVKRSAWAIKTQIEKEKKEDPGLLLRQLDVLRASLESND